VYARVVLGEGERSLSLIAKNIGFLVKNIPLARKKAEAYFGKAIETFKRCGATTYLKQAKEALESLREK